MKFNEVKTQQQQGLNCLNILQTIYLYKNKTKPYERDKCHNKMCRNGQVFNESRKIPSHIQCNHALRANIEPPLC